MWVTDQIRKIFKPSTAVIYDAQAHGIFGTWFDERRDYSTAIWYNICDILLDLAEDTEIELDSKYRGDSDKLYRFAAFRAFYYTWGKVVMQRLYDEGFVVIGWDGAKFWQMNAGKDYSTPNENDKTIVRPLREDVEAYVMKSACWLSRGASDRSVCRPWLEFLDDVCNGSATISKRLGAVVVGSPKTYSGAPTPSVLTEEQKKQLEKEIQEHYGTNSKQSQLLLLPKEMTFQTISLASLDIKFVDKVRECILAICDRIKVPANQVAIIDANSSKSLSNGGELREGDKAKYKSFKRLMERTFVQMAMDMNLSITYRVNGEPADDEGANVSELSAELLGVLTTDEKREALGYDAKSGGDKQILAQTLGVGGTQSLVEIVQSESLSNAEKQQYLQVLFGLNEDDAKRLAPDVV